MKSGSVITPQDMETVTEHSTNLVTIFFGIYYIYVAISDPSTMKFVYLLGQSPRNWKTTMHQNEVLTIFHTQNIGHHAWKIVRITLQLIGFLQPRGESHEQ